MSKPKALHLIVHGRVQGVGFRYFCLQKAKHLNISGWVKNKCDGTVEVVCEGESEVLYKFIDLCKSGNTFAKVSYVDIQEYEMQHFSRFSIDY